jgi:hypothetical protein
MAQPTPTQDFVAKVRWAGVLYLIIIVTGLSAELGIRMQLIHPDDAAATVESITAAPGLFWLGIVADIIMAVCDAALAVLLYLIFRSVAPALALAAMVFRLVQTVLIAANLMAMQTALLILTDAGQLPIEQLQSLVFVFVNLHGYGYDLGLFFFGINSLITGVLIYRSGYFSNVFGAGLALAGIVYLIGSSLRFGAPEYLTAFAPLYGITIIAETAFCLRLLLQRKGI